MQRVVHCSSFHLRFGAAEHLTIFCQGVFAERTGSRILNGFSVMCLMSVKFHYSKNIFIEFNITTLSTIG